MKKIIFRVDDRLIHGQVIEGWIKHYKIATVYLVNESVCEDSFLKNVYGMSLPFGVSLVACSPEAFLNEFDRNSISSYTLIIFESVSDLCYCKRLISEHVYINLGCLSKKNGSVAVSDSVYLDRDEYSMLNELSERHRIHIHTLPWKVDLDFKKVKAV